MDEDYSPTYWEEYPEGDIYDGTDTSDSDFWSDGDDYDE